MARERAYHMYINNEYPDLSDEQRYKAAHDIEVKMTRRSNDCRICYAEHDLLKQKYKCL